ncbi:hypothetical protein J7I84_12255 [Arthrobacter sp. ISL-85]|uniref:hypothetical protein n=1 Tax=Arthrobacter sp. ISL-85 TaxID=2819115 RepID=UPI001BE7EB84|nr:hypothetical protein [Arthrobacter sp. ISL-85]MBT2567256.1 hypothetical protein [Arthrobacter sp. ISL-85]
MSRQGEGNDAAFSNDAPFKGNREGPVVTHLGSFAVPAAATFGRDGAMFESLLSFVAQMSLVLWSVVTLTAVIRFVGIRFYRRAARRALARIAAVGAAASAAVPNLTGAGIKAPGIGTPGPAGPAAAPAAAIAMPAIAVVPAIAAGMDLVQPANLPLAEAFTNVLASNSVDG